VGQDRLGKSIMMFEELHYVMLLVKHMHDNASVTLEAFALETLKM
jgi:hypothetical protein